MIEDIDGYSIESIGKCSSENAFWFQCTLVTLNVICLFVALVLCWRTKDIPSDFSESNYIFLSVMFMFQVLLLTVPISTMVEDDANVLFFIQMGGVFLQNFTVLMLIFLPKMRRIYIGEDTTTSIKNAIATDRSRRESVNRSSFISSTPSRLYAPSICSNNKESMNSMDIVSSESLDLPNSYSTTGTPHSVRYGRSSSIVEVVDEESKPTYFERANKTEDRHDEEKLIDNRNGDDEGDSSKKDGPKIEKQMRSVSWRHQ